MQFFLQDDEQSGHIEFSRTREAVRWARRQFREACEQVATSIERPHKQVLILTDVARDREVLRLEQVVEPAAPACTRKKHLWQDRPGVFAADGGGVYWEHICAHCNAVKITSTRCQDRATGELLGTASWYR